MEQRVMEDEKTNLLPQVAEQHHASQLSQKRRHVMKSMALAILLLGWWLCYAIPALFNMGKAGENASSGTIASIFDFEDIVPSEKLEWHSCFAEPFQCARLTVPMDYHRPLNASKDNPKVYIAMVLVPGKHTGSKQFSKSPLLLNPGGPGGAGTLFALSFGHRVQTIIGNEDQDVIGFDPRGIGATTPRADCFSYPYEGSEATEDEDLARGNFHRMMWQQAGTGIGTANSSSGSLQKLNIRARTIAKLCEEKDSFIGKDSILKYAHTPSVARDMISIIDAWDELTKSLESNKPTENSEKKFAWEEVDDEKDSPDTKGKLVYWGFSYGTLLGATFASMFPNRVGRVILDGVVDADHYVAPIWTDSIRDADIIFDSFAGYCHEAKSGCALYRNGDRVEDIQERFLGALQYIEENPITVIEPFTNSPVIISISDIRMILFSALYSPTAAFPLVASLINFIYEGHEEILGHMLGISLVHDLKPTCESQLPSFLYPDEAQLAVMCSDKRYPLNETLPLLETRFEKLANLSSWGDVWMTIMIGCQGWNITAVDPPMRWDDHPAHKQKPIKTSHPLLFISNTADPVTPLKAGVKMAKKFIDAGLIEQKSEGHCSIAAVSKCTNSKIRAYFGTGEVPPPPTEDGKEWINGKWVKCEADEWPFHPYDSSDFMAQHGSEAIEDAERMTAVKEVQDGFSKMKLWGQNGALDDALSNLNLNWQQRV